MELKEDFHEREEQLNDILLNPNSAPQEIVQLYDAWTETYEKVTHNLKSAVT